MRKKSIAWLLLAVMALFAIGAGIVGCGGNSQTDGSSSAKNSGKRLIIYTSMKESLIGGIVNGFRQKHPDIAVDFHSAGAGVLMERIAAERQSGHIQADVIWTSEVSDFYWMKQEGLLEPFRPTEFNELLNPLTITMDPSPLPVWEPWASSSTRTGSRSLRPPGRTSLPKRFTRMPLALQIPPFPGLPS